MRLLSNLVAATLALSASSFCSALSYIDNDLQIHGFFSQGYLLSDGNNFYGNSQRGTTDFMEAAVNANYRVSPKLNLAAQIITRDAGTTDNGDVKIDFLFADYKAIESELSGLGFRLGRVRNSFGFYNDTRDVLFTRPTILMPQSVYFEGNGLREILFASDGAQLYSYWDAEENTTSLSVTFGRTKSLSADIVSNLFGRTAASFIDHANVRNPIYAQLSHSRDGGTSKYAISTVNMQLEGQGSFGDIALSANGYVLSAQKNLAKWTFTAEYSLFTTDFRSAFGNQSLDLESAYVQSQYRLAQNIVLTGRYEMSINDKSRPNQSDSHHLVAGINWAPAPQWVIAADIYGIRGTNGIPHTDYNDPLTERTEILAIMVGFRF